MVTFGHHNAKGDYFLYEHRPHKQNIRTTDVVVLSYEFSSWRSSEINDILTKARTYFTQSIIYYSLYELDNYIETKKVQHRSSKSQECEHP